MELELRPPAEPDVTEAVRRAAEAIVLADGGAPAADESRWLRHARSEAVERAPERDPAAVARPT